MLQSMGLGLLEVVTPVDRVKPAVQEKLCPLPIPNYKTTRRQPVLVLCDDEIYSVALEVAKGLDNAIRGYDGSVGQHVSFQLGWCEEVGVNGQRLVHDQSRVIKIPEEGRGWKERHGVADSRYTGPCRR